MILWQAPRTPHGRTAWLLSMALALAGCSHTLEVTNLGLYKPQFINNRNADLSVGLSAVTSRPEEERFVTAIGNALKRDGFEVVYPYTPQQDKADTVDFLVKLNTHSEYKGSGWNFLINWPGFLVWAPAWHGYNYRAIYTFDADIIDAKTGKEYPRVSIPVDLDIRHADIDRTWTEISWLEWSVIAFVGGIVFTRYDQDLTPDLLNHVEPRIADYVSSRVASMVLAARHGTAASDRPLPHKRFAVVERSAPGERVR